MVSAMSLGSIGLVALNPRGYSKERNLVKTSGIGGCAAAAIHATASGSFLRNLFLEFIGKWRCEQAAGDRGHLQLRASKSGWTFDGQVAIAQGHQQLWCRSGSHRFKSRGSSED